MTEARRFPTSLPLLSRQAGHQLRIFVRVPVAVFFTIALPFVVLLIINATSVGMAGTEQAGRLPLDADLLDSRHTVVDLVYSPIETAFLEAAAARAVKDSASSRAPCIRSYRMR